MYINLEYTISIYQGKFTITENKELVMITVGLYSQPGINWLNMELDLQSLFGLHVHRCTHWLSPRPCNHPPPPPGRI